MKLDNQKEAYLVEYQKQIYESMLEFLEVLPENYMEKIEKKAQERRNNIDKVFKNGLDVGGLIKYMVYPFDIVYIKDDSNIIDGFYWIVKERKKVRVYPIRF